MKKKNNYIQIFKMIACILITNSHCIYPDTMFKIAGASSLFQVGGGWGNAMFLGISGYLVACTSQPFWKWMKKRYVRIIPISVVCSIILFSFVDANNIFIHIVKSYWFITAIVIYYPLVYIIDKSKNGWKIGLTLYLLIYIVLYIHADRRTFFVEGQGFSAFKVYSFFIVMCTGALLKRFECDMKKLNPWLYVAFVIASVSIWALEYGNMIFRNSGYEYQFFITISRMMIVIAMIGFMCSLDKKKELRLRENGIVNLIADSTLEIYLVQIIVKAMMQRQVLFESIILFWGLSIILGIIMNKMYTKLIYSFSK
ncbi:acyltransferase family protein [Pseudobutyrivibrio ruminis]|uniref:Acyltransferase 3 domain-containing protein n=1 Tax=Pseudobutyrivibrio ruminis TaxID=46206 RepID=A0A2G3DUH9_9FIRM|nr:acyltransferase [Pseudobutyrivibrio ruminis]PHU34540.1 hypothetical protein CSX01_09490 [Pseudobutyrivibrio ruminis]